MKKRTLTFAIAVLMLLSLTACGKNNNTTNGNSSNGDVTQSTELETLPETESSPLFSAFESTTVNGEAVTEKIFTGNKLTFVNLWGTFCAPCIYEMPYLEQLSKNYADKGVVVIGVLSDTYDYVKQENKQNMVQKAENIISQTGVTYENILPSASLNRVKLDYVTTYPTTYILDENGVLLGEYVGSRSYDQWAAIVDRMLEKA